MVTGRGSDAEAQKYSFVEVILDMAIYMCVCSWLLVLQFTKNTIFSDFMN